MAAGNLYAAISFDVMKREVKNRCGYNSDIGDIASGGV